MALTSQASTSANFQVRGFSTEPKQFRRVSIGEQRARKKSATEGLTERQSQFASRESHEELKASCDEVGSPTELSGIYKARQVDVISSSDKTEDLLHSSVSYVRSSHSNAVSQTAEESQSLPPVSDESQQDDPSREHSEARRDSLEIVQTSLAQSQSLNEDVLISPHGKKIFQRASPVLEKPPCSIPTRKHSGGVRDRTLEIVQASLKRSTSPVGEVLVSLDNHIDPQHVESFLPKRTTPVPDKSPHSFSTRTTSGDGRDKTLDIVTAPSPRSEVLISSDSNIDRKHVEKFLPKKVSPVPNKSPHSFSTRTTSGDGRDRTLDIVTASLPRSAVPVCEVLISSDSSIDPKHVDKFLPKKAPPVPNKSPHSFPTRKTSGGRDRTLQIVEASLKRSTSPVADVLLSSDSHIDPKPVERFSAKKAPPVFDKSLHSFPTRKTSGGSRNKTLEFVEASLARSTCTSPVDDVFVSSDSHKNAKPIERFSAKKAPPVFDKSLHSFPTRKTSGGSRNKTLEFVEASLARSKSPVDDVFVSSDSHKNAKPIERFSAKKAPPVFDKSLHSFPTRKTSGGSRNKTLEFVEASLARSTSPVGDVLVYSDSHIDPKPVGRFSTKKVPPVHDKSPQSFPTRKHSGGGRDRTLQIVEASLARSTSPVDLPISPREKSFSRRISPVPDKFSHSISTRKLSNGRTSFDAGANISSGDDNRSPQLEDKSQPRRQSPSDHQPVEKSYLRGPSPVFNKSPHTTPIRARGSSRDRTLQIVAASLALSASSDDGNISSILAKNAKSSASVSPVSSREEAGGHVRKLKEHFLSVASTESESDSSHGRQTPTKLQKSDSSPSSNSLGLEKGTGDHKPAELHSMSQKRRDVIAHRQTDDRQLGTNPQGGQKWQEESQLKAVDHSRSRSTSSEEDPGLRNEKRGKSLTRPTSSSSDSLDEQTRRQIERFKARYAAADAAKQNSQKGKINRIVLKPPAHAGDIKDRSKSAHDSASPKTSIVRPRPQTTKDIANQPIEASVVKTTLSKPKALYSSTQHSKSERISAEKRTNYGTLPKTPPPSYETSHKTEETDLKIPETLTSDDVRRMRRAKQLNVSGKTPERWGDADESNEPFRFEEFHKPQRAILEHAVFHGGDRTVVQVGGTTFPVKQEVSDAVYKENLPFQDPINNHRRDKSTSDEGSVERSSGAEEVTALLSQNQNQNDILAEEPLKPKSKHEASPTGVFYKHVMKSPQAPKGFKKTSWAPVSFGQTQDKSNTSNLETTHHSLSPRKTISPNMSQPEKQTSHCNSSKQPLASQDNREHAKSALQNFLSGIMISPRSPESPCNQTQQKRVNAENNDANPSQNDGNGNCIVTDAWTISSEANVDKGGPIHREVVDVVNLNYSSSIVNKNEPISVGVVPPASVELTRVHQDPVERKQSATLGDEVHASRGLESKSKMQHSREGLKNAESEKRRNMSENSEASLSRRDGAHSSPKEQTGSLTEKPHTKKISLSGLLSQDVQREQMAESQGPNEHSKKCEVDKHVKHDSNWLPPPRPDCYHGDDSESDTEEELRRSKVLRVKKSSRAEKRTEDNSLQNLLSRIINPEDELNTLKRGKKSSVAETSHKSAKDANSNSMYASENATKLVTTQPDVVDDKPTFRKPLLNINLLQRKNRKPVRQENLASPPESMASPTRQGVSRRRSKSDLGMSPRCSVSSAPSEVEHFFNQMGLNDSFFQSSTRHFSDSEDVFHNMYEYKHRRDDGSFSTEQSDNISQGSKVSEEGLHLAKKLPDTSQSIITKNARVIKWLCQMRKARAASFS